MAFPPTGTGIIAIKYAQTGRINPFVVTHGFEDDAALTPNAIATNIVNAWVSGFTAAKCLVGYQLVGGHVLINRAGALRSGDDVRSVAGTVNTTSSTPAVTGLIKKGTTFAGKRFRGRMYLPCAFIAEANVDNAGFIDAATLASLQTAATTAFNAFNALTTLPELLHRDGSGAVGVTSWTVENMVATQRRRQRK